MEQHFCILGNAMNAKSMQLGEEISRINFAIALISLSLLTLFILN